MAIIHDEEKVLHFTYTKNDLVPADSFFDDDGWQYNLYQIEIAMRKEMQPIVQRAIAACVNHIRSIPFGNGDTLTISLRVTADHIEIIV